MEEARAERIRRTVSDLIGDAVKPKKESTIKSLVEVNGNNNAVSLGDLQINALDTPRRDPLRKTPAARRRT